MNYPASNGGRGFQRKLRIENRISYIDINYLLPSKLKSLKLTKLGAVDSPSGRCQFYLGLQGLSWLNSLTFFVDEMQEMLSFTPQCCPHYRRGLKAVALLQSVF